MTRARFWARVSTSGQDEDNQLPKLRRYADDSGYDTDPKLYLAHGKSAFSGKHADLLATALDDMAHGEYDVLLVLRVDRLDRRGPAFVFDHMRAAVLAGGRIEFADQPHLNGNDMSSEVNLAVLASLAKEESRVKSARITEGRQKTRTNGGQLSRAPYGYRSEGDRRAKYWVPVEAEAAYVKRAFASVAEGQSLRSLLAELTAEAAYHGPKTVDGIARMVRDSSYQGMTTDAAGAVVARPEAIVDAGLWASANRALSDASRKGRGPNKAASMLRSAIRCGHCGSAMYVNARHSHYRCSGSCGMVSAPKTEMAVERLMRTNGSHPVFSRQWFPGATHDAEIAAVTFELQHLAMAGLDEDEEDRRRAQLRSEKRRLEALPSEAGHWEEQVDPVHMDYAEWWQELSKDVRGKWMKEQGFSVMATKKTVTVEFPWGGSATLSL